MPDRVSEPRSVSEGKRHSWLARHEWSIVGLMALLSFLLGCYGYFQTMTFESEGGRHSWWDPIYASLQLFIF